MALRCCPAAELLPQVVVVFLIADPSEPVLDGPCVRFFFPTRNKFPLFEFSCRIVIHSSLEMGSKDTHFTGAAVIGNEENQCVFIYTLGFEHMYDSPNVVVHRGNLGVVNATAEQSLFFHIVRKIIPRWQMNEFCSGLQARHD